LWNLKKFLDIFKDHRGEDQGGTKYFEQKKGKKAGNERRKRFKIAVALRSRRGNTGGRVDIVKGESTTRRISQDDQGLKG